MEQSQGTLRRTRQMDPADDAVRSYRHAGESGLDEHRSVTQTRQGNETTHHRIDTEPGDADHDLRHARPPDYGPIKANVPATSGPSTRTRMMTSTLPQRARTRGPTGVRFHLRPAQNLSQEHDQPDDVCRNQGEPLAQDKRGPRGPPAPAGKCPTKRNERISSHDTSKFTGRYTAKGFFRTHEKYWLLSHTLRLTRALTGRYVTVKMTATNLNSCEET